VNIEINGETIETDEQGYLRNLDDWSEEFAAKMAEIDGIELFDEHWGLILYFRDFYQETLRNPTMRELVLRLGKQNGLHFHDKKAYEKFIYKLFPTDPAHELCKLAGLPKPPPDT